MRNHSYFFPTAHFWIVSSPKDPDSSPVLHAECLSELSHHLVCKLFKKCLWTVMLPYLYKQLNLRISFLSFAPCSYTLLVNFLYTFLSCGHMPTWAFCHTCARSIAAMVSFCSNSSAIYAVHWVGFISWVCVRQFVLGCVRVNPPPFFFFFTKVLPFQKVFHLGKTWRPICQHLNLLWGYSGNSLSDLYTFCPRILLCFIN